MKRAAFLAAALIALPAPALAQAYQCAAPLVLPPLPRVEPDGPRNLTPVRSLTLALSWSPEFCRSDHDPQSVQCSGKYGRFGFIVHGLWPEGGGNAPQWCTLAMQPSPETVRRNLCMTPVPYLIAHEWAKHGSCMAASPDDYYRTAHLLWDRIKWPDIDMLSRKKALTVGDLRQELLIANPKLRRDAIGVLTNDRGWLRELRLCYSRSLRPQPCRKRQLGPADSAALKIWRGI
ncbi:MAG: ribonuclease T [Novosphingobium sp.]